jgi:hypothetical protein
MVCANNNKTDKNMTKKVGLYEMGHLLGQGAFGM